MGLKNNVFPLFLKGDAQVIASGNAATIDWNGKTSFIHIDDANAAITSLTLGNTDEDGLPIKEGVMVVVRNTSTVNADVDTSATFITDTGEDVYTVGADEDATFMFLGYDIDGTEAGWVLLSTGSSVSGK
jgi:hypothetical protein